MGSERTEFCGGFIDPFLVGCFSVVFDQTARGEVRKTVRLTEL
jgi:hypothetical protein